MNGNKNTNFTVINCNKGNSDFKNRKADIEHILRTHKPDFMTVHELNITDKDPNQNNNIPGYNLEIDQLYNKFGRARTGIFIKENIKYQRLKEIEDLNEPVVWIQINLPGNKKIKLQSYYRQWRQLDREGRGIPGTETQKEQNIRFKKIAEIWSQQIQIGETLSFSDTNINLDKKFQNTNELENCERTFIPIYRDLNDLIFNKGAAIIKTAPTKIYDDKPNTFIDHCISSHPKKIINHKILEGSFSDHLIIKFIISNKKIIHSPRFRMSRDFGKMDWEKVKEDLANDNRIQLSQGSHEVNTICENLIAVINDSMDAQQPCKRIQVNKKYPAFASKVTRETIEDRNKAMTIMKTTGSQDDIREYRTLRNRCHKLIRQDKEEYLTKKFKDAENNSKQQWKTTKDQLGWTKNLSPTVITRDGKTLNDPTSIANAINFAQVSRNTKLHRDIPKTDLDYRINYRKLVHGKNLHFSLRTISMNQMKNKIKNMKPTNSAGMDGISTKTLKKMIKPLHPTLLNLINQCIETATYHEALKTARIVPLLKKGKPETEAQSYRAINILPSIGKLIDRVINRQIIRHMETNKLFIHQHNGAIKGRSTMTAVLSMLDDWATDLENGKENAILVLDQSAAYDVISHQKLIEKMKILGWDENAILYFQSYLENRKQSVTVDTFQSDTLNTGPLSVCQGSTLSGLLYLIYTLDYPLIRNERKLSIKEYDESTKPKTTTFVDDSICKIELPKKQH